MSEILSREEFDAEPHLDCDDMEVTIEALAGAVRFLLPHTEITFDGVPIDDVAVNDLRDKGWLE